MFTARLQPCQAAEDMKTFTDSACQLGEILEYIDSLMNTSCAGNVPPTSADFCVPLKQSKVAEQPHTAVVLLRTKHFMSTVITPASETQCACCLSLWGFSHCGDREAFKSLLKITSVQTNHKPSRAAPTKILVQNDERTHSCFLVCRSQRFVQESDNLWTVILLSTMQGTRVMTDRETCLSL